MRLRPSRWRKLKYGEHRYIRSDGKVRIYRQPSKKAYRKWKSNKEYDRKLRVFRFKELTEIIVYGIAVSNEDGNDYVSIDASFYVHGRVTPQEVLAEIEKHGYHLIRHSEVKQDRVTVAGRVMAGGSKIAVTTLSEGISDIISSNPVRHYIGHSRSKKTVRANDTERDMFKEELGRWDNEQ